MTFDFIVEALILFKLSHQQNHKKHFEMVKKGILIYLVLEVNVCMFSGIEILEGISNSTTSSGV
jgi:hypothetical protein